MIDNTLKIGDFVRYRLSPTDENPQGYGLIIRQTMGATSHFVLWLDEKVPRVVNYGNTNLVKLQ